MACCVIDALCQMAHNALSCMQAPVMLTVLLSRFEVELDESMGGVEGMRKRQCITFGICIDQVTFLAL